MSHLVTIRAQIRDLGAVEAACRKLSFPQPTHGKAAVFEQEIEGTILQFPNWRFPVVINLTTGSVHYDNYEGRWGDLRELHRFTQRYSVERSILEARRQGHSVQEESLADGSIRLLINVGEG